MANRRKVFSTLNKMFKDPSPQAWGGAQFVRSRIRSVHGLTHAQAKTMHSDWAENKHPRAQGGKFAKKLGVGTVSKGRDGSISKSIKRWQKAEAHPTTGLGGVPRKAGGRH